MLDWRVLSAPGRAGVNREAQGIQVGLWRVLTEWYTQKSFFKRMVRNESFDAL